MSIEDSWDFFMFLQGEASPGMFDQIWGNSGTHFYNKFTQSKSNIIYFWPRLDPINKAKLIAYYYKKCDEPKNITFTQ